MDQAWSQIITLIWQCCNADSTQIRGTENSAGFVYYFLNSKYNSGEFLGEGHFLFLALQVLSLAALNMFTFLPPYGIILIKDVFTVLFFV